MRIRICLALLMLIVASSIGMAQDTNNSFLTNVSGGDIYTRGHLSASVPTSFNSMPLTQPVILPNYGSFNGWDGSFAIQLARFIGIVADGSGLYGSQQSDSTSCTFHIILLGCEDVVVNGTGGVYTLTAGPRVAFRLRKFTPFADVLFGVAFARGTFTPVQGCCIEKGSNRSFANSYGAGVAYQLGRTIDWYLRVDLLQTRLPTISPTSTVISATEFSPSTVIFSSQTTAHSNFQASTGISLRFCALHSCRPAKNK